MPWTKKGNSQDYQSRLFVWFSWPLVGDILSLRYVFRSTLFLSNWALWPFNWTLWPFNWRPWPSNWRFQPFNWTVRPPNWTLQPSDWALLLSNWTLWVSNWTLFPFGWSSRKSRQLKIKRLRAKNPSYSISIVIFFVNI